MGVGQSTQAGAAAPCAPPCTCGTHESDGASCNPVACAGAASAHDINQQQQQQLLLLLAGWLTGCCRLLLLAGTTAGMVEEQLLCAGTMLGLVQVITAAGA
jgi:hypothetical protein